MVEKIDVLEAIMARHSVRGYLPDAVSRETLEKMLETALRAPSAMNTQPWRFTLLSGVPLERARARNTELLAAGTPPHPDSPIPAYAGEYRERQVDVFRRLLEEMRITPDDRAARRDWQRHGYRFFEAPVVVLLHYVATLETRRTHFDLGLLTQNIALAALGYGLGSCCCLQAVSYPETLREISDIPETDLIALGIAIGYPDPNHPANRLRSPRLTPDQVTRWLGFV